MNLRQDSSVRVLYSFPHKLGTDRICNVAWQQVTGVAAAGGDVLVCPGVLHKAVPAGIKVRPTLARAGLRIPYKALGSMRAFALHDWIVSRRIEKLRGQIDIIHAWPLGCLRTLKTASELGIPTILERPNAHTRFAMEVVQRECQRLGVTLAADHEHAYNAKKLAIEEEEYKRADFLLCPSDFVARTFLDEGFSREKLLRHQYGFDAASCFPSALNVDAQRGLTVLFAGGCAPRKGLHYALEAWLRSDACNEGTFLVVGEFVPGYAEALASMLSHRSVQLLGYRRDLPELMRKSDIFVLPSIEEGSALVTSDARANGCVLLVSDAAGAICKDMENALVHRAGDVDALTAHLSMLNRDRHRLTQLRAASLKTVNEITWAAAGAKLLSVYRAAISIKANSMHSVANRICYG